MAISHPFDEEKATQAAAFLAAKLGRQVNYLKLMKLLYLADRDALKKWGRPICGGPYVSMDYGPLISPAYDAVKNPPGSGEFPIWSTTFQKVGYDVELRAGAGVEFDSLSQAEVELLENIILRFGQMNQFDLVRYTHVTCHEWRDPQGSSVPIPESEILTEVGRSEEELRSIELEARKYLVARDFFIHQENC